MRSSHESVGGGANGLMQYCQDHVFVFTTSDAAPSGMWIAGFLAVFAGDVPRLAWTSYDRVRLSNKSRVPGSTVVLQPLQVTDVPEKPTTLDQFALKVPLAHIYSLWKHTPDLGAVPVVKVTVERGKMELPPFLFYHGGVRELFHSVRLLISVSRSREDPDLYLLNDSSNLLYRSVSCADEIAEISTPGEPELPVKAVPVAAESPPHKKPSGVVHSAMSVLSSVGRLARAAANALPHSAAAAPAASAADPAPVAEAERAAEFKTSLGDFQVVDDYAPVKSASEVSSVAKLMPKPERSGGVDEEVWIASFDAQGRILPQQQQRLRDLAFSGGIAPVVRREMWKYLLHYYSWNSSFEERAALRVARAREYEIYRSQWQSITPMQLANFSKFRDRKHLVEKDVMRTDRMEPYFRARAADSDSNYYDPSQNPHLAMLHDILVTYSMFNFDLSYVQGMNDLLGPILTEVDDEVDAFWCFKGLMDTMAPNFRKDQSGMSAQLRRLQSLVRHMDAPLYEYLKSVGCENFHFTFRWLLLHLKRELDYDGVKTVWETIWSSPDPEHFLLFIVFAILQQIRDRIIEERLEFDTLVQLCNGMASRLQAQYLEILSSATHWFAMFPKLFPDATERARILL